MLESSAAEIACMRRAHSIRRDQQSVLHVASSTAENADVITALLDAGANVAARDSCASLV